MYACTLADERLNHPDLPEFIALPVCDPCFLVHGKVRITPFLYLRHFPPSPLYVFSSMVKFGSPLFFTYVIPPPRLSTFPTSCPPLPFTYVISSLYVSYLHFPLNLFTISASSLFSPIYVNLFWVRIT